MRAKLFPISILAAAAFLVLGLGVANLEASQYLGEITWTYSGLGGGTIKAGISKVGGSYYEVQGQADTPNGPIIFSGGGALVENTFILSGTATLVENNAGGTYYDANIWRITLDKSYNGTMWIMTTWYNNPAVPGPPGFGNSFDTGNLTWVSGPSNPAAIPQSLLLLQ